MSSSPAAPTPQPSHDRLVAAVVKYLPNAGKSATAAMYHGVNAGSMLGAAVAARIASGPLALQLAAGLYSVGEAAFALHKLSQVHDALITVLETADPPRPEPGYAAAEVDFDL